MNRLCAEIDQLLSQGYKELNFKQLVKKRGKRGRLGSDEWRIEKVE